jgi:hypothetical protein
MPTRILPAASLRGAQCLPAARPLFRIANYLICTALWSIRRAIIRVASNFLPALREGRVPAFLRCVVLGAGCDPAFAGRGFSSLFQNDPAPDAGSHGQLGAMPFRGPGGNVAMLSVLSPAPSDGTIGGGSGKSLKALTEGSRPVSRRARTGVIEPRSERFEHGGFSNFA